MSDHTQDQEYLKKLTLLYVEDEEDAREKFKLFSASFCRFSDKCCNRFGGSDE